MVTVFAVKSPEGETTRLHLACTAWGEQVRSSLVQMGFSVDPTNESQWPDTRGPAELARRDFLLGLTGL